MKVDSRRARLVAWWSWGLMLAVPAVPILGGGHNSTAFNTYMKAGLNWWQHGPLYDLSNLDGFQYFPHAAWLFAPFWWLGAPARDLLWRACEWALYATGVWQLSRRSEAAGQYAPFVYLSPLAFGPAINSLLSGQVNLALAAFLLLATAALMEQRWLAASVYLVLGATLKPLLLAPLVMLAIVYPPLRVRSLVGIAVMAVLPFLVRSPQYVLAQYADCVAKLRMSAAPSQQFEDFRGLLSTLQLELGAPALTCVRLAVGAAVLAACMRLARKSNASVVTICALSANYLVLFNPRSQPNSYVLVGAFAGLFALRALERRRRLAFVLHLALVIAWSLNPRLTTFGALWLRPLGSLVFFAVLAQQAVRERSELEVGGS